MARHNDLKLSGITNMTTKKRLATLKKKLKKF
jgi:hypothetical protein